MAYSRSDTTPGEDLPAALVRTELAHILASELFARSARLSSFLNFIVGRTLAGEGDSLKEQVIAVELYGKSSNFDTAADPIVRVDARRLRDRLREYYADAPSAAVIISVPKGSYVPVFRSTAAAITQSDAAIQPDAAVPIGPAVVDAHPQDTRASTAPLLFRRWSIAAAIVLIAAAGWVVRSRIDDRPVPRVLTVTSLPGSEEDPALSPDGRFVAFSWGGPSADANHDIWIKAVDGDATQNLTNSPDAHEQFARWSPDGQWITFSRASKNGPAVIKVSALGGHEQTIADASSDASWTPDGHGLVMRTTTPEGHAAIVHHELETGARRRLTDAPVGFGDAHPRVSPDGKTLALARTSPTRSAILLVPMGGGEPAVVGDWTSGFIGNVEWMPDGHELLVSKSAPALRRLMRVPVDGRGPEVPVADIPYESAGVSIARVGAGNRYRLAVSSGEPNVGLRLVDLGPAREGHATATDLPFCTATRMDAPGRFSPDGKQVAFASDRSGSQQIWVANRDGSAVRPVTQLRDATVSLGSWSPDGGWLTFDATMGKRTDIYVVAVGGGAVRRLTDGTGSAIDAEWSRDGRRIYFSSNRSGRSTIWRMAAAGGGLVQLTSDGGFDPRESPDGRSVYFIDEPRSFGLGRASTLKRVSANGGPVEVVDVQVLPGAWDMTDSGIVFVADRSEGVGSSRGGRNVLQFYGFANRRIQTIGQLGFLIGPFGAARFLAVSRDGRWALASHIDRWERDILVLDGFR